MRPPIIRPIVVTHTEANKKAESDVLKRGGAMKVRALRKSLTMVIILAAHSRRLPQQREIGCDLALPKKQLLGVQYRYKTAWTR